MAFQILLDSGSHQPQSVWSMVKATGNCSAATSRGPQVSHPSWSLFPPSAIKLLRFYCLINIVSADIYRLYVSRSGSHASWSSVRILKINNYLKSPPATHCYSPKCFKCSKSIQLADLLLHGPYWGDHVSAAGYP